MTFLPNMESLVNGVALSNIKNMHSKKIKGEHFAKMKEKDS